MSETTKHRRYRIDLNYVGTGFTGWQAQPDKGAVQDHLEKALETVLRQPLRVNGASRTDSGVHAKHQVATFDFDQAIDTGLLRRSLHALLPNSIGIESIAPVDDDFHAIRDAKGKAYRYWIWNSDVRNAFLHDYTWRHFPELDVGQLRELAQAFVGRHDFSAFCSATSAAKTKERTIFEIDIERRGALIEIWIIGDGFLKQMVRSMIGTLIDHTTGKFSQSIESMLAGRDRTRAGQTAPAAGLCLYKIFYDQVATAAELKRFPSF